METRKEVAFKEELLKRDFAEEQKLNEKLKKSMKQLELDNSEKFKLNLPKAEMDENGQALQELTFI